VVRNAAPLDLARFPSADIAFAVDSIPASFRRHARRGRDLAATRWRPWNALRCSHSRPTSCADFAHRKTIAFASPSPGEDLPPGGRSQDAVTVAVIAACSPPVCGACGCGGPARPSLIARSASTPPTPLPSMSTVAEALDGDRRRRSPMNEHLISKPTSAVVPVKATARRSLSTFEACPRRRQPACRRVTRPAQRRHDGHARRGARRAVDHLFNAWDRGGKYR